MPKGAKQVKPSGLSVCALFTGCLVIAACSQAADLSRLQYTPNVDTVRDRDTSPLSYSVLYNFGSPPDGNFPTAGLTDVKGVLYGTTSQGGVHSSCPPPIDCTGTVFSITTGGVEKVLHSFGNGMDGQLPYAPLIDVKGKLYGTTYTGGAYPYAAEGGGTVFSIATDGTEKVLHSFGNGTDGAAPFAGLVDVNGTLYGTTSAGGYTYGTVFSITTDGTEKVLYRFTNGSDGAYPDGGLIYVKGKLYGTAGFGANGLGNVFSVTTGGVEKVLHSFGKGTDGSIPNAPLVDVKGTLYGTTEEGGVPASCGFLKTGCGTVFSVTTHGAEKVLHSFGKRTDGIYPEAGLIDVRGILYGTTYGSGAHGNGTVFSITTSGTEKVLHRLGDGDGAGPKAALMNLGGTLYGTTYSGGASNAGVVFKLMP